MSLVPANIIELRANTKPLESAIARKKPLDFHLKPFFAFRDSLLSRCSCVTSLNPRNQSAGTMARPGQKSYVPVEPGIVYHVPYEFGKPYEEVTTETDGDKTIKTTVTTVTRSITLDRYE